jgi:hypothetical protein
MIEIGKASRAAVLAMCGLFFWACNPAAADVRIEGQVQAGGAANSTVTLWAASAGEPRQLAQVKSGSDGRFLLLSQETPGTDVSLYLVAKGGQAKSNGDNLAIALLTVLGNTPPAKVVINEMTTVASAWTNAQFLDGTALKGYALGLRVAAGNVPNFVDLETGGYGVMIQDGFNSTQTPTMANFATLSSVLAGCTTRVRADACDSLFAAATGRDGNTPTDTLKAALSIARDPGGSSRSASLRCWTHSIQCPRASICAQRRSCLI